MADDDVAIARLLYEALENTAERTAYLSDFEPGETTILDGHFDLIAAVEYLRTHGIDPRASV